MAMGRFGSISLAEISEDEYEEETKEEPKQEVSSGSISFSEISFEEIADETENNEDKPEESRPQVNVQAQESKTQANVQAQDAVYSEKDLDNKLSAIRESLKKEMEDELVERIKWITLGAGINTGAQVALAGGGGATVAQPVTAFAREEAPISTNETVKEDTLSSLFGVDEDDSLFGSTSSGDVGSFVDEDDETDSFFDDDDVTKSFFDDEESLFDEGSSEGGFDIDSDDDEFNFDFDDNDEDDEFSFDDDDMDSDGLFSDDESEEYEPAPFLFAELLAEAAEEYANMGIEERMEEMGEDVIEITVEELASYIKEQRKKK
jgi:hypothetical protein